MTSPDQVMMARNGGFCTVTSQATRGDGCVNNLREGSMRSVLGERHKQVNGGTEKGVTNSDPGQGLQGGQWNHNPLCGPVSLVSPV